jgi:hypothetical protein
MMKTTWSIRVMSCTGAAVLIVANSVVPCRAVSKKFPLSCDSARKTIMPWLETHGFRVTNDDPGQPNEGEYVVLKGKRPKGAEGTRIWNLQRYVRKSAGLTGASAACFEALEIVGVSAKLRFRPVAEGCAVSLVHRYLAYRGDSCRVPDPRLDPLVEARSNSKLEGEYLSALRRSLGEVPDPPTPVPSRRPADRERQVLFVPEPGIPRPLPRLRTEDIEANLAGKPLKVVDVAGHERTARTPVVVVLDFANTSFRNHPCLVAELAPVLDKIGRSRDFEVFVTGGTISPFFNADFGVPGLPAMLLFSYPSQREPIGKCLSADPRDEPAPRLQRAFFGYESRVLLRDLGLVLSAHPGPYRVFWIADSFGWIDTTLALTKDIDPETDDEHAFENVPHLVSGFMENLSEAGVSIFPVLLPQRSRRIEQPGTSGFERSAARYLAALTGGFMTVAGTAPGHTLERLLAASDDGYVFRLRAPMTGRRFWDGMPHTLNVTDRAENLSFRRGFTVSEEGSVETSEGALDRGAERLFVPSRDLRLVAGCPGRSSGSFVALFLPRQVLSTPASKVHVLISYTPVSGRNALRQRFHLARPQASASEADWPAVCFDIEHTETGTSFSLVAFDEGTEWIGALNGSIAER